MAHICLLLPRLAAVGSRQAAAVRLHRPMAQIRSRLSSGCKSSEAAIIYHALLIITSVIVVFYRYAGFARLSLQLLLM